MNNLTLIVPEFYGVYVHMYLCGHTPVVNIHVASHIGSSMRFSCVIFMHTF